MQHTPGTDPETRRGSRRALGMLVGVVGLAALIVGVALWRHREAPAPSRAEAVVPRQSARPHASSADGASAMRIAARRAEAAAAQVARTDPTCGAAWGEQLRINVATHLEHLRRRNDADAWLAIALLRPLAGFDAASAAESVAALETAVELRPHDPLALWMLGIRCGDRCARSEARLTADQDNAAVWLGAYARAQRRNDTRAADAFLARALDAPRYEVPIQDLGGLMLAELQHVQMPPTDDRTQRCLAKGLGFGEPYTEDAMRLTSALAVVHAAALPAYAGVTAACPTPPAARLSSERLRACRRLLTQMATSPLATDRLIALSRLARLTADAPDGAAWREAYRRHYWTLDAVAPLLATRGMEFARRSLLMGEWPAMESLLADAGRSEPPPGWLPEDARQRALVLTGREPPG